MRVQPVRVHIPRRLASAFKRKSRDAFPLEEYAILLGDVDPDGLYHVEDLYYPEDRLTHSTSGELTRFSSWFDDAEKIAAVQGLEILGDIHSHCYNTKTEGVPGAEPSETDWVQAEEINKHFTSNYQLIGICRTVLKNAKYRSTIKFWPVTMGIETRIT